MQNNLEKKKILDGVGPNDDRPFIKKFHQFKKKKNMTRNIRH